MVLRQTRLRIVRRPRGLPALSYDALIEVLVCAVAAADMGDVRWLLAARAVCREWRDAAHAALEREWVEELRRSASCAWTLRPLPSLEKLRKQAWSDARALSHLLGAIRTVRSHFHVPMEELRTKKLVCYKQERKYGSWSAIWYCDFLYTPATQWNAHHEQVQLRVHGFIPGALRRVSFAASYGERDPMFSCGTDMGGHVCTRPRDWDNVQRDWGKLSDTGFYYHIPTTTVAEAPTSRLGRFPVDERGTIAIETCLSTKMLPRLGVMA